MLGQSLLFLDLETTGVSAARDRVIEIGLCEVEGGRLVCEWSTLVNPQVSIPPFIVSCVGIDDAMVAGAPTFAELAPGLRQRLAGRLLVAHNARFDCGFLTQEFGRLGLPFAERVLCTLKLSRRLFPRERRHGLDVLIARHGLVCGARHRALGDARVLWDFVQHLYRTLPAETVDAVAQTLVQGPDPAAGEALRPALPLTAAPDAGE